MCKPDAFQGIHGNALCLSHGPPLMIVECSCLLSYPLETGSLEVLLPRLRLPSSESLSAAFVAVSPLLSGRLELSAPFSSAVPAAGSVN